MQRMWKKIHPKRDFKDTRAHSYGRKALQVRRVREIFLRSEYFRSSSAGPRGREELRVWRVRKEIHTEYQFKGSLALSHWRKTLPVSSLSHEIQPEFDLEETRPENAPGPIRVQAIIRLSRTSGAIWYKTRNGETSESSRSFVVSSSK